MSQEENQENARENSEMFGGLGKWARYGLAGIGVFASFAGLVLVILVHMTISPSIGTLKETTLTQVDTASSAVANLDRSLQGTYDAMNTVPGLTENLSSGFSGYAASTNKLALGIDSLADQAAALPGGSSASSSLKSAAQSLYSSGDELGSQSESLSSISSSMRDSQQGIKSVRGDLAKAKSDLSQAKRNLGDVFDSASNALLLGCMMFALVFIALGAYSVALFL